MFPNGRRPITGSPSLGLSERPAKTRLQMLGRELAPDEWWQAAPVRTTLLLVFAGADFANFYLILEAVLGENPAFLLYFTAVLSLLFTFVPVLCAKLLRARHPDSKSMARPLFFLLPAVFLLLVGIVLWFRYTAQGLAFSTGSLVQSYSGKVSSSQQDPAAASSLPLTFLLGLFPVGTAAASFVLAFLGNDPLRREKARLKQRRLWLFEQAADLESFLAEYGDGRYGLRLLWEDEGRYSAALNEVEARRQRLRSIYRFALAETLGDPAAVSLLTAPQPYRLYSPAGITKAAPANAAEG